MTASLSFTSISRELFPLQTIGGDVGDNDDDYDVGDNDDAKHLLRQFKHNSQWWRNPRSSNKWKTNVATSEAEAFKLRNKPPSPAKTNMKEYKWQCAKFKQQRGCPGPENDPMWLYTLYTRRHLFLVCARDTENYLNEDNSDSLANLIGVYFNIYFMQSNSPTLIPQ